MPKKHSKSRSQRRPHLDMFRTVAENVSGLKGKARAKEKFKLVISR